MYRRSCLCSVVFMAINKNDVGFWIAFAIIMIINVTITILMVFDNTYGCLQCNNVKKQCL